MKPASRFALALVATMVALAGGALLAALVLRACAGAMRP
jgi:hypothetical protein